MALAAPLVALALTLYLVFKQPSIKIPFSEFRLHIDHAIAPWVAVALLMLFSCVDSTMIRQGIVGTENLRPVSILTLILSLAYISSSLDSTGFFSYLGLRVVKAANGDGRRLFVYLFLLPGLLTLVVSNDVVTLTMTHIIFYTAISGGINPVPYLIGGFFAVNVFGAGFYTGNPTNIVAADACCLTVAQYAKWMLLPAMAAGFACLAVLYVIFRRQLPRTFTVPDIAPETAFRDRPDALLGAAVLFATVLLMCMPVHLTGLTPAAAAVLGAAFLLLNDLTGNRTRMPAILSGVPWKIVPFLLGLFVIIESAVAAGWADIVAAQLLRMSHSTGSSIFGTLYLSAFSAGVMNNHPMTILFVRAFHCETFVMDPAIREGSILALIAGSNFGANFTPVGALAGLMWAKIVSDKGCKVSFGQFTRYGLIVMPFVIAVTAFVLLIERLIF